MLAGCQVRQGTSPFSRVEDNSENEVGDNFRHDSLLSGRLYEPFDVKI